jgi:hypothetical protein
MINAAQSPLQANHLSPANQTMQTGSVTGMPSLLLRLEGVALFAAAATAFAIIGGAWTWFAIGFLLPDLAMIGYLISKRFGALTYNLAHTTSLPLILAFAGHFSGSEPMLFISLIWLGHIGFDRAAGYGLKYPTAFKSTHLGRIRFSK